MTIRTWVKLFLGAVRDADEGAARTAQVADEEVLYVVRIWALHNLCCGGEMRNGLQQLGQTSKCLRETVMSLKSTISFVW